VDRVSPQLLRRVGSVFSFTLSLTQRIWAEHREIPDPAREGEVLQPFTDLAKRLPLFPSSVQQSFFSLLLVT
jgi:hypothetical protein